MATILDLPIKRPNEEEEFGSGSGSGQEVSKKAKMEPCSDCDGPPDFDTLLGSDCDGPDFDSFEECHQHFGDYMTAADYWVEYPHRLKKKWTLRDFQLSLIYTGQVDKANSLRRYDDLRKLDSTDWERFNSRPWRLQPTLGHYDVYQRLLVPDDLSSCEHDFLFCSHETDLAYLKFYAHLLNTLEESTSQSFDDLKRVALGISNNYKIDDPCVLDRALMDSYMWKQLEDRKKEFVPVFAELWEEIVKNKRAIDVVVKEVTERDKDMYSRCKKYVQVDSESHFRSTKFILAQLERYISTKTKGNSVNNLCTEDLVKEYSREDPPGVLKMAPYSNYVKKKIRLAEKLGIEESLAST